MKTRKRLLSVLISGALIVALVSLLGVYALVVSDLDERVYTESQRDFLSYNSMRSVKQAAPTWNYTPSTLGEVDAPAITFPVQDSQVRATLVARYEEKDRVSVTVYDLDFRGEYHLTHSGPMSTTVKLYFPFPENLETLHDVRFVVDGEEPDNTTYSTSGIAWHAPLSPDQERVVEISYKADGANSFAYGLMRNQRADVDITVNVVGLNGSSVGKASLPASQSDLTNDGEIWTWHYDALIADRDIHLDLPTQLSFAQRVSQLQDDFRDLSGLAPFLVVLFMASLAGIFHLEGVRLRLISYLLIGFGLALFYPLLTFLSGLVPLVIAAVLSMGLISGLVLVFMARAVGGRTTLLRTGLLLTLFVGFLSLGMLTPWRGLLLTAGALGLVGLFMWLYARRAVAPEPEPEKTGVRSNDLVQESGTIVKESRSSGVLDHQDRAEQSEDLIKQPEDLVQHVHCPYCARPLEEEYAFCPGCGHDTAGLRRCGHCGHLHLVAEDVETVYCVRCGKEI